MKNLVDELLELSDPETDSKIIRSFQLKDTLCPTIFDKNEKIQSFNNAEKKVFI